MHYFIMIQNLPLYVYRLGDKRFSSNESLETISWGAVSEKDKRYSGNITDYKINACDYFSKKHVVVLCFCSTTMVNS